MSELRKRFVEDLSLRNYARRTIETYTRHVACFARHFGRSPEELGPEEIRGYQLYLIQEKRASWLTFNQAVCALRFLYRITLPRDWAVSMIAYAKKPKKLPCVLGAEEVEKLLGCARPAKLRMVLATLYAAGSAAGRGPAPEARRHRLFADAAARAAGEGRQGPDGALVAAVADGITAVLAGGSAEGLVVSGSGWRSGRWTRPACRRPVAGRLWRRGCRSTSRPTRCGTPTSASFSTLD